jgi:hypothetical protein
VTGLEQAVESIRSRLTPGFVEAQVRELLRQGKDVGGGINAFRLIQHWLGALAKEDAQVSHRSYEMVRRPARHGVGPLAVI